MSRIQFSDLNRENRNKDRLKREKHFIDLYDNRFERFKKENFFSLDENKKGDNIKDYIITPLDISVDEYIKAIEIYNELLERIISTSELNYNDVRFKYKRHNEFEKVNGMIFFPNVVEDYFREYGKLIPLELYLNECVSIVKEHFKGQETITWVNFRENKVNLTWNDSLIEGIKSRSMNSYLSSIIEIIVEEYLKEISTTGILKNVEEIVFGDYIDRYLGVDILVKHKTKRRKTPTRYIHIARDSKMSRKYLEKKATREVKLKNNVWFYREVYRKGHEYFLFNETVGKQNNVLRHGNIYVPDPIAILEKIDSKNNLEEDGEGYKYFARSLVKAQYTVDEIKNNFRKIKFDGVENE